MREKKSIITHFETHLIWFACRHIYRILFFPTLFVKINVAFPSSGRLLCMFTLLWLLSVVFISLLDEIRPVYGSTLSAAASITAAAAASGLLHRNSSSTRLLLWFPRWQAEGQVTSLDLVLAPPP